MQTNTPKIFISHAWEDKPLVRRLENELKAAGAEVWVDHEGIRGGDNLPERISEALEWCNTLVLVWSKTASQSRWVRLEWTNAVSLEKAIIPCRLDGAALPAILAHKAYLDFKDIEPGLAQLLQALKLPQPTLSTPTTPEAATPVARMTPSQRPREEVITENLLRLRSAPATLAEVDVKAMLQKYDFYCRETQWSKSWSNPRGNGIDNKFELRQNGHVVFDHTTDLIWQQGGLSDVVTFAKAEEYVYGLNAQHFEGFNDWRLPTLEEAMSLMENEEKTGGFYLDLMFAFIQRWIWMADEYGGSATTWAARWVVGFYGGHCAYFPVGYTNNVRVVRAAQ